MRKFQIIILLGLALAVFGCNGDQPTNPTSTGLQDMRLDQAAELPGTPNANPALDPKEIVLSEEGLEGLFGPDKLPPCIQVIDNYGFVWTLSISGGVVSGTADYFGAIWDVSGTGRTINAYTRDPAAYCDFVYYVEFIDKPSRTASGSWANTSCSGTGTWSGTGGACP